MPYFKPNAEFTRNVGIPPPDFDSGPSWLRRETWHTPERLSRAADCRDDGQAVYGLLLRMGPDFGERLLSRKKAAAMAGELLKSQMISRFHMQNAGSPHC